MKAPDGGCVNRVLAHRDTQPSDGQGGMSKKAMGAKRPGRFANTGGDCGSAERGAIGFHLWWSLRQQTWPVSIILYIS